jgi:transcriptional regulator with GAF, ATPase, and Fis domain
MIMRSKDVEQRDAGAGAEHLTTLKNVHAAISVALQNLTAEDIYDRPDVVHGINFYNEVRRFETSLILGALKRTKGNQRHAATLLGLKPTTLNAKIKTYRIDWRL